MAELAPLLQPQGGEQGSAVRLYSGSQGCALVITGLSLTFSEEYHYSPLRAPLDENSYGSGFLQTLLDHLEEV